MIDSVDITYDGIEITVKGDFIPYQEGKTQGDPDSCYPPEGGYVEDYELFIGDNDITDIIKDDILATLLDFAYLGWQEK